MGLYMHRIYTVINGMFGVDEMHDWPKKHVKK